MSLSCEIVMDLSAVYHDGVASETSVEAIDEHLKQCPRCRNFYREYKALTRRGHTAAPVEDGPDSDFAALAFKLKQRHMMVMTGVVLYACVLAGAATFLLIRGCGPRIRLTTEQFLRQVGQPQKTKPPLSERLRSVLGRA